MLSGLHGESVEDSYVAAFSNKEGGKKGERKNGRVGRREGKIKKGKERGKGRGRGEERKAFLLFNILEDAS